MREAYGLEPLPKPGREVPWKLGREGFRALVAFGLYVASYPLWIESGAQAAYRRLVLQLSAAMLRATEHFPIHASVVYLHVESIDSVVVLVIFYALVSTGMSWSRRFRNYGILMTLVVASQVVSLVLERTTESYRQLLQRQSLEVLLPWEFMVADRLTHAMIFFGLGQCLFIIMACGAAWNSGIKLACVPTARRPSSYKLASRILLPIGAFTLLVMAYGTLVRERNPAHIRAHIQVGKLCLAKHALPEAAIEFRSAIKAGTDQGEAWYSLAGIERQLGHEAESRRVLRKGLEIVKDEPWREKMRKVLQEMTQPESAS